MMTICVDEISAFLLQKLKAYEKFRSATGLLQKALESGEMTTVDHCIQCREELIRNIGELDRRINRHLRIIQQDQNPPVTPLLATLSSNLDMILKEIIAANHDCDTTLASRCEVVRKELMIIRQKEEGLQGYFPPRQRLPKFLNVMT